MELQGTLRAVPRDGRAVETVVPAAGLARTPAPPLPLQLTLHLRWGKAMRKWGSHGV